KYRSIFYSEARVRSGSGELPCPLLTPGVVGSVNRADGVISTCVVRHAVVESRLLRRSIPLPRLCFANYLLVSLLDSSATPSEPTPIATMADGSLIPETIVSEIKESADALTVDVAWEA